jgi:hypothetical protein
MLVALVVNVANMYEGEADYIVLCPLPQALPLAHAAVQGFTATYQVCAYAYSHTQAYAFSTSARISLTEVCQRSHERYQSSHFLVSEVQEFDAAMLR